jgi:hypothetical protein
MDTIKPQVSLSGMTLDSEFHANMRKASLDVSKPTDYCVESAVVSGE